MHKFKLLAFALCISLLPSFLGASATTPRAFIKFKNLELRNKNKLKKDDFRRERKRLDRTWEAFINKNPKSLLKKGKDYKIDQKCVFELNLDKESKIDLDSLDLISKKNDNFSYSRKALEFIKKRRDEFYFKKKNRKKPAKIVFKYYSF